MDEYIGRDATIQLLKRIGAPTYAVNAVSLVEPIHFFADIAPVVHGRWIEHAFEDEPCYGTEYECSNCGRYQFDNTPYCPNCGARMDGE